MVKLFGGLITLTSSKKVTYRGEEDKGRRDITLTHMKSFRYVSVILWVFCGFLTLTIWLGDPITCFSSNNVMGNAMLTSYCFIQTQEYQW